MRNFPIQLLALALPAVVMAQTQPKQLPSTMTKIVVKLAGPNISSTSRGVAPKTIYVADPHFARIEDPPDARLGIQKLTIIAEPDAYSANLIDKKGTHATDQGGENDLHLPIILPFDPKHELGVLDKLEFGDEVEFFHAAGASSSAGAAVNGKSTKKYTLKAGTGSATLVVDAATEAPLTISWEGKDGTYSYEYLSYDDIPFDGSLFSKPAGINFKEIPPDTTPHDGQ